MSVIELIKTGRVAERNGFVVVQGEVQIPEVKGEQYTQYNHEIYAFLLEHYPQTVVNMFITKNSQLDKVELPGMKEMAAAMGTEEGSYLREYLRLYIMCGINADRITKMLGSVANAISKVTVMYVDTEAEAWEVFDRSY